MTSKQSDGLLEVVDVVSPDGVTAVGGLKQSRSIYDHFISPFLDIIAAAGPECKNSADAYLTCEIQQKPLKRMVMDPKVAEKRPGVET
jgi:hypothetical protein